MLTLSYGLNIWLDGSLPCPDEMTDNVAAFIWKCNNGILHRFIQVHVSKTNLHLIKGLSTSALMFAIFKEYHEKQGTFTQLNLLIEGLYLEFTYNMPLDQSLSKMCSFSKHIITMGQIKNDDILSILILHGLNNHFGPFQHSINTGYYTCLQLHIYPCTVCVLPGCFTASTGLYLAYANISILSRCSPVHSIPL